MRALSASELLAVWEQGLSQGPVQRGLTLLAAACPETPLEALARLSLGQRDACLLALREWTFGPHLTSLAKCPGCGERLELNFDVADIRALPPAFLEAGVPEAETLLLNVAGYEVRFRLPNSLDLTEVAAGGEAGRQTLFERCLLAVRRNGRAARMHRLPAEVISAVAARMGQADPQAEVHLALTCPACGCNWQPLFDIVSFFWSEINSWAHRILYEVHTLASAYGWREADILAMSQARRQLYLEMVSRG
jgi:hypothetical protein